MFPGPFGPLYAFCKIRLLNGVVMVDVSLDVLLTPRVIKARKHLMRVLEKVDVERWH